MHNLISQYGHVGDALVKRRYIGKMFETIDLFVVELS